MDTDYDFVLSRYHQNDSYTNTFRTFIIVYYFIKLVTCHVLVLAVLRRKHLITCVLLHPIIGVVSNDSDFFLRIQPQRKVLTGSESSLSQILAKYSSQETGKENRSLYS